MTKYFTKTISLLKTRIFNMTKDFTKSINCVGVASECVTCVAWAWLVSV